jgi:hypothetical protein
VGGKWGEGDFDKMSERGRGEGKRVILIKLLAKMYFLGIKICRAAIFIEYTHNFGHISFSIHFSDFVTQITFGKKCKKKF